MYPHVKQFETRRQELEQRFGIAEARPGALARAASAVARRLAAIRA
jgi:hypothetical protein